MRQKPITIVVSDLHLGGGKADPGDDHVYQQNQFRKFISRGIPESKDGKVELIINGDFLEFAQVRNDVYKLGSSKYWCSENESLEKLSSILSGHEDIFLALKEFQRGGNQVTMVAGNHDVDLFWPKVRSKMKRVAGPVQFALGRTWHSRYDGRLQIGHGHMFDPANRFKQWKNPILRGRKGVPRLEMCPGTLFMVKFVNSLEAKYPFADNVKPIMTLAKLLYAEPKSGYKVALWTLVRFAGRNPISALGIKDKEPETNSFGRTVIERLIVSDKFARDVASLYHSMGFQAMTAVKVRGKLKSEADLFNFLTEMIVRLSPDEWLPVFSSTRPSTIGIGNQQARTLSVGRSAVGDDKTALREKAKERISATAAEVVVCGHTHQPDEWRGVDGKSDGGYFNPGSWTRFLDIGKIPSLRLADLKKEEDFPYELNFIRIEAPTKGKLRAEKICYEKQSGARWLVS